MRKTASITTLGCKSNQYDSAALEEILRGGGVEVLPFPSGADAYVINTCTVTGKTDTQSRQLIRKVRRLNPEAVVIVTGCYAQVSADEVLRIEGVDYVLGNPDKERVLDCVLKGRQPAAQAIVSPYKEGTPFTLRAASAGGRTRANLKIQEGCNRSCSYCIIPKARGASKSLSLDIAEREIEGLIEAGFKEIILTGIHLGAYGDDFKDRSDITSILGLIEKRRFPARFRISSLDPDEVTDGLIEILSCARYVCPHLHLPLQSGDDAIIRKMHRPYTSSGFAATVERLADRIPGIAVGIDVIAGFPGEGQREFENTVGLIKDLPLAYLHVFPFSKRKGTPAATYPGQVNGAVIRQRCERLRELDEEKRTGFYRASNGKISVALTETARDTETGLPKGRTENYIPVLLKDTSIESNQFKEVRLEYRNSKGMFGGPVGR